MEKDFECHFVFETVVETNGRDAEGALENLEKRFNQGIMQGAESIMTCGMDFDRDQVQAKEIENGWFELTLRWSGSWLLEAEGKESAKLLAQGILDVKSTLFYRMLENESTKQRRFVFKELKNEKVVDVTE